MTTCKRCGSTDVAWVQSTKTNKWYLAVARQRAVGRSTRGEQLTRDGKVIRPERLHKCGDSFNG